LSSSDPFLCYIEDSECVRNLMKAEVKRLTDKVRDQQDLFDKRKRTYNKEVTRLKLSWRKETKYGRKTRKRKINVKVCRIKQHH